MLVSRSVPVVVLLALGLAWACAAPESERQPVEAPTATAPSPAVRDIERIEVRADGSVRFRTCIGSLTLHYPDPPPTPKAVEVADAGPTANAEHTIAEVRPKLKACYQTALASGHHGPTKVTWLIAIGPDGTVASASARRDCNAPDSFKRCLADALLPLKFDPPGGAGSKITMPVTFIDPQASSSLVEPIGLDGPALQACVTRATTARRGAQASATFKATGADVKIDHWTGDEELLQCAAEVLQKANATFEVELVLGG